MVCILWTGLLDEEPARLEAGTLQCRALAPVLVNVCAPFERLIAALTDEQHTAMDRVDVISERRLAAEGLAAHVAAVRPASHTLRLVLGQQGPCDERSATQVTVVR